MWGLMKNILYTWILFFGVYGSWADGDLVFESHGVKLKAEVVMEGLEIPWSFAFLPDGGILVTEKDGRILWKKASDPPSKRTLVQGVPEVYDGGQGGLMDIVLHPQFSVQPYVYLTYSISQKRKKTTRVSRALWANGRLKNPEVLFTARPFYTTSHHFGSRLVFDQKGFIFFSVGDRGKRDLAQSLKTHNGKIIRLHDDGRIPKDNPFQAPFLREIWSYGHRNPQGLVMRKNELWLNEHGPRGGDEINRVHKGKNYGWPVVTYGKEYIGGKIGEGFSKKGMEDSHKHYIPSIAPSGMAYYEGKSFSFWRDSFFIGSLVLTHLNRVFVQDFSKEERLLGFLGKRVRDVRLGPDGYIYLSVEQGELLKIIKNR